ncbi:MAG TPA: dephospho-CoA kinase [Anaerolineae bacterium]|nr:dephospho-CoA kinase [Anaerolineae bacterium]
MKLVYVIGLTGNIATGKSTVAQILEQLGARVIDADMVTHAVLKRGSPAWRGVVDAFGYDVLHYDGTVDRRKLGGVVFADPTKLRTLERITHPAVGTELALIVRDLLHAPNADSQIVVIEAVKLFESGMHQYMDALWVVTAPREEQKRRLIQERGMSEADAEARLRAQPPLDEKLKQATVVIDNGGSIEETRVQVMRAFISINPQRGGDKTALLEHWLRLTPQDHKQAQEEFAVPMPSQPAPPAENELTVRRSRPSDTRLLAELLARIEGKNEPLTREEMLKRQGTVGYWLAQSGEQTVALAAWEAENLAAVVNELWAENKRQAAQAFPLLLDAIQTEANALTCEVVVIVAPPRMAELAQIAAHSSGYEPTTLDQLHKVWRSVVGPMIKGDEVLYAKRLREMVTEPI